MHGRQQASSVECAGAVQASRLCASVSPYHVDSLESRMSSTVRGGTIWLAVAVWFTVDPVVCVMLSVTFAATFEELRLL